MKRIVYLLGALAIIVIVAYVLISERRPPINQCVNICKESLAKGKNLTNGPCLANPLPSNPDWVCDVAHSPRQAVDNLKQNQCSAYGKTAKHFIEVDPSCHFIRAV